MRARLVPLAASFGLHAALVGTVAIAASAVAPRAQIMFLELIQPETPPVPAPAPTVALSPARPSEPPRPARTVAAVPPEPPARPAAQAPTEAPPALEIVPAPPSPMAPVTAPSAMVTLPASPATTSSGPAVAATPNGLATAPADGRTASAPAVAAIPREGGPQRVSARPLLQPKVQYPAWAPRIEGTTLLKVLVADDGQVAEVQVTQSAGHRALDDAAASTVKKWRFAPARRNGEPVATWVEVPIQFTLR